MFICLVVGLVVGWSLVGRCSVVGQSLFSRCGRWSVVVVVVQSLWSLFSRCGRCGRCYIIQQFNFIYKIESSDPIYIQSDNHNHMGNHLSWRHSQTLTPVRTFNVEQHPFNEIAAGRKSVEGCVGPFVKFETLKGSVICFKCDDQMVTARADDIVHYETVEAYINGETLASVSLPSLFDSNEGITAIRFTIIPACP